MLDKEHIKSLRITCQVVKSFTMSSFVKCFTFVLILFSFADDQAQFIDSPVQLARRVTTYLDGLIFIWFIEIV